jgi:hypothetical protein
MVFWKFRPDAQGIGPEFEPADVPKEGAEQPHDDNEA